MLARVYSRGMAWDIDRIRKWVDRARAVSTVADFASTGAAVIEGPGTAVLIVEEVGILIHEIHESHKRGESQWQAQRNADFWGDERDATEDYYDLDPDDFIA